MTDLLPSPSAAPQWDLADRLRKALRSSGVGVSEMADYLGVARNTVSTWINGRITPSTQTLRLFSLRCGVPYEWLTEGVEPEGPHTPSEQGMMGSRCNLPDPRTGESDLATVTRLFGVAV